MEVTVTSKMESYERWLRARGLAESTVRSYVWVATYFERTYDKPDEESLRTYRDWLLETFRPATANQRVQAINCYLGYLDSGDLRISPVRVQTRTFLVDAVDDVDYRRLTKHLQKGGHLRDYHAVRLMATTGARVSELLRMRVEDMRTGYLDLSSKGKVRRIWVPDAVAADALSWAEGEGRSEGPLLLNWRGQPISARGLSQQLKTRAVECGLDERAVHPHAFRHLFARSFLAAGGDISLLSDLLGHSSIETTRVYLRRTASDQRRELNRLVSWA